MATNKVWWNGSAWTTSETTCVSHACGNDQGANPRYYIKIYADTDFKIWLRAYGGVARGSVAFSASYNNQKTVRYGSTTVGSGTKLDTGDFTKEVTSYTKFNYSGSVTTSWVENYNTHSGATCTHSGSIEISSPFRTYSYAANGGSGAPSDTKVIINVSYSLSSTKPTRTGYTFAHWNTKADDTGTSYASGASVTATSSTASTVTLYAIWTKNNYTVSISAGEGTTITFDGTAYTNTTTTVSKPFNKSCSYTIKANAGWVLKTYSPGMSGTITIPPNNNTALSSTGQRVGCRVYNGSVWKQAMVYVYNGSQWKMCQVYVFNGSQWKLLN